jgi:hypothetical protein
MTNIEANLPTQYRVTMNDDRLTFTHAELLGPDVYGPEIPVHDCVLFGSIEPGILMISGVLPKVLMCVATMNWKLF